MRKYTTGQVARQLEEAEATVRKHKGLPVVEQLSDGTRLYDADRIDRLALQKAMAGGDVLELTPSALIEKFSQQLERCTTQAQVGALLDVTSLVLHGASDTDRRRLAAAVTKAIFTTGKNQIGAFGAKTPTTSSHA